ncbi:MAG: flavodoxin family protein [Christensenellaceae bacterium]|nr:flavodoxin family protein [Christensenellaceae bacterium]
MKVILHDLDTIHSERLLTKCDAIIEADGKYAPCKGCFGCWTKHPAECFIKDKLHTACRILGRADELIIITKNLYGAYSTQIKNVMDRTIGSSTPLCTYRKGEMHHTLRYGKHNIMKVLVYGDITEQEKATFTYMAKRNAINDGYRETEVLFFESASEAEAAL